LRTFSNECAYGFGTLTAAKRITLRRLVARRKSPTTDLRKEAAFVAALWVMKFHIL
jgi:hypothetical protein